MGAPKDNITVKDVSILVICLVFLTFLFVKTILSTFPFSPLHAAFKITESEKFKFRLFFPEGFAFFTRDAQEEQALIYSYGEGIYTNCIPKNGSSEHIFGLSKKGRYKLAKLNNLLSQIDDLEWKKTTVDTNHLLEKSDTIHVSPLPVTSDYFEGHHLIIVRKPVPWAWAAMQNLSWEYRYVAVDIDREK